jgi:hypothetical protein
VGSDYCAEETGGTSEACTKNDHRMGVIVSVRFLRLQAERATHERHDHPNV